MKSAEKLCDAVLWFIEIGLGKVVCVNCVSDALVRKT